jgi:S1-C subfamily serine protease
MIRGRRAWIVVLCVLTVGAVMTFADERDRSGRAWLGVWLSDAVDGGAQVNSVVSGGPAERGGILAGDVVIEAAGRPVGTEDDLGAVLRSLSPGDELAMKVLRAGRSVDLSVELISLRDRPTRRPVPAAPPVAVVPGVLAFGHGGLTVSEITPDLRVHFGAPESAGVLVTRVEGGSLAAEAGLRVGDVLVGVNDREIRTERDLRVNLVRWNSRTPLTFRVIRGHEPVLLDAPPPKSPPAPFMIDAHQLDVKRLETEIERLERRLSELRQQLEHERERERERGD